MSYRITVPRKVTTALDFDGAHFILHAPFTKDSWINELAAGSWDKQQGFWKLPPYIIYANTVLEQMPDISISPEAQAALESPLKVPHIEMLFQAMGDRGLLDADAVRVYTETLFPYQREAVDRLVIGPKNTGLGAIFPGGGKTIVALVAARILCLMRVLIIAPKPLLRSWENEATKFFGENWLNRCAGEPPTSEGWVLTNYETAVGSVVPAKDGKPEVIRGHAEAYRAVPWDLVILDESVLVKNRDAKRFKEMLKLRKAFPRSEKRWWELSGSPTTRYADDLWAQLHLQDPKGFGSYWRFTNRVCYVSQDVWGTQVTGTRQNVDITGDLKDVMFVVSQEEVLPDLPEEIPQLVEVQLTPKQLKAYLEMNDDFVTTLESGEEVWASKKGRDQIILSKLIRLQQITSNLNNIGGTDESAKTDALVEMLRARSFAMPALIWTNWKHGAHAMWKRLGAVSNKTDGQLTIEYVNGDFPAADNEEKFEAYKAGNIDILIVSMPVGKFGHNLQMTRTSIYHDKTWFADDYVQTMKRVKRIGLKHRPVAMTIKAIETTDELIEENLSGKFPGIAKVTNADLAAMLRHLRGGQA